MRVREPGRVMEGLWFLGREESGVYVLQGSRDAMMISGGMSYIVPDVMQQMEELGIDRERISRLLILHAHFDHVGIVPFVKRTLGRVEVSASARAWELLRTPKVLHTINEFGRSVAARMGREEVYRTHDLDWRDDITGGTVGEGDRIDLGGLDVRIMETPGHSSCSISAYAPQMQALFPSDAGGIPFKDIIVTSGNSDYTQFQRSLERMRDLPVAVLCADHYGYVCGGEAAGYIGRAVEAAAGRRALMEEVYGRTRDIDAAARELTETFFAEHPDYLLTPAIFEGVFRQMVRHIAGQREKTAVRSA
jgi:glyoxylase-like metal-dependent hydrolase (beta-lactamase superfamily II)